MSKKTKKLSVISCWVMLTGLTVATGIGVFTNQGCSTSGNVSSRQAYADTNDAFIAGLTILIEAKHQGKFTDEQWREKIYPLIKLGNSLINQYDAATKTGGGTQSIYDALKQVLTDMQPFLVDAAKPPSP